MIRSLLLHASQRKGFAIFCSSQIACAIIVLSLSPLDTLPEVACGDKTHHLIAYGALAFPTAFARGRYFGALLVAYVFLGGAIEVIQPYANRFGEWLDFAANGAGIMAGTLAGLGASYLIQRHQPG